MRNLAVCAALAGTCLLIGLGAARAADHREAPSISFRPAADLNDLYVFASPDNSQNVVLIMTVNPVSDPDFASTYAFDPAVTYQFAIDTNGDARFENRIDVQFRPVKDGRQDVRFRLNGRMLVSGQTTPSGLVEPVEPTILVRGPVMAFAGPVDDPFFFDGVGFQLFSAGLGGFRGEDSFAGLNVSAIAVEMPLTWISQGSSRLEIAAFTYGAVTGTDRASGGPPLAARQQRRRQLDRVGNPGVATVMIPLDQRDRFNGARPSQDAALFRKTIVDSLRKLGTPEANIDELVAIAVPDTLSFVVGQPSGFPNGRRLEDDVIDTLLFLVLGEPGGDGVGANDARFESSFPYLALPHVAAP